MKQLTINPNNRQYYSEDFIKGFECGTQRQLEADKADRPQGKWIRRESWSEGVGMGESYGFYYECSNCGKKVRGDYRDCGMNYCPNCGADMKGADNETD